MARPAGLIIAIDGVVGAGKSSTARGVAARLGYRHLDTGAMYRAVALAGMRAGVEPGDAQALASLLAATHIELLPAPQGGAVLVNGEDVSEAIRQPEVSRRVGAFADSALVRRALVPQQQRLGADGGVVAEGRDIASVVFPDAEVKIRLVASLAARAQRRLRELTAKGVRTTLEQVTADIRRRDAEDAARDYGASGTARDVIELNTTGMTLDEQIERVVALARRHGA